MISIYCFFAQKHPDDYDRVMREIGPVLHDVTGNTIFDQEYRLNTKDRGWRWFHATGDVSRREDGSPVCFFGVFLDITEQKEHAKLEQARNDHIYHQRRKEQFLFLCQIPLYG